MERGECLLQVQHLLGCGHLLCKDVPLREHVWNQLLRGTVAQFRTAHTTDFLPHHKLFPNVCADFCC